MLCFDPDLFYSNVKFCSLKTIAACDLKVGRHKHCLMSCMARRYIIEDQAFEPTMIGWTPRCYRPSFMETKYLDPEKNILKGVYTWA